MLWYLKAFAVHHVSVAQVGPLIFTIELWKLIISESTEGTVKPMSGCEVVYYGVTGVKTGIVSGPSDSPLRQLFAFPLVCAHSLIPSGNQSVSLRVNSGGLDDDDHREKSISCETVCGASGCNCRVGPLARLEETDHLLVLAGNAPVGCLCGMFSVSEIKICGNV